MTERQPIPKSVRFEVFKRDGFACQYCGQKAPDVVLHVDHIKPVATGGDSSIMNLLTACAGCNAGKGPRELGDDTALSKQMAQMQELNERRAQIEMMVQWREDLLSLDHLKAEKIEGVINAAGAPFTVNEHGRQEIAAWVRRHPFDELLHACDEAFRIYFRGDQPSWETAFGKVPGVLKIARVSTSKPWLRRLFYVRGILRKRLPYVNDRRVMGLMEQAVAAGISVDDIEQLAKDVRNWTQFESAITAGMERVDAKNS